MKSSKVHLGSPIFVCAPMPRSGTTYCKYLVDSHPSVYRSDLNEDFFLYNANKLTGYVDSLYDIWSGLDDSQNLSHEKSSPDSLLGAIGETLLRHVGLRDTSDRMILKTPRLYDLDVALRLFPGCQVVIMIRDPRSIVSSYLRAQRGWDVDRSFEEIAEHWAVAVRGLSDVLASNQEAVRNNQFIIVRYERLVASVETEFHGLLRKLNLPITPECRDAIENPVVRGSSFLPFTKSGHVNFRPQPMPTDFNPLNRWSDWTPERHARINRICGSLMKKWGYIPVTGNS